MSITVWKREADGGFTLDPPYDTHDQAMRAMAALLVESPRQVAGVMVRPTPDGRFTVYAIRVYAKGEWQGRGTKRR